MLDGKEVGDAILEMMRGYAKGTIIAVDRKAIQSTGKSGNSRGTLQILSTYLTESGVVLTQESIYEKTNEIPVFQKMLIYLDVRDKIITADAMHCQRKTSQQIVSKKEDYVFDLKENQPGLLEDVRLFFEDAALRKECESFQTVEKNAGRIEKRICRKAPDVAWLREHKWPGLNSVFAMTRIADVRGRRSEETGYYISTLDASAKEFSEIVREHWKIESMHWLLDVTFSEDSSQFMSENAHKIMNSLRKFALAVHKNFLAASGKKRSIKANMLVTLISPDFLIEMIDFL